MDDSAHAGQQRFGDLLGRDAKEENHEDFVNEKVDRDSFAEDLGVVTEDAVVHHIFVGMDIDVGENQAAAPVL